MAVFEYIGGGGGSSVAGFTSGAKLYVAFLTQTGTDAPVATVLQNDLGGEVVWTRNNTGRYYGTLAGVFTVGKTWLMLQNMSWEGEIANVLIRIDADTIQLYTSGLDGIITADQPAFIMVIVYP